MMDIYELAKRYRHNLERCLSFIGDDLPWESERWEDAERFMADIMPSVRELDRQMEALEIKMSQVEQT